MKKDLFIIGISILAAIVVMLVHEIVKSFIYYIYVKKYEPQQSTTGILKIWHYIDPIGIIMAFTRTGIFSKQYNSFLIKSKKAAITIGIAGYASMAVLFTVCCLLYRSLYGGLSYITKSPGIIGYVYVACPYFLQYCAFYSVAMFTANIFPLTSFDISLIIAGNSQKIFMNIKNFDSILKLIFVIILITGLFSNLASSVTMLGLVGK